MKEIEIMVESKLWKNRNSGKTEIVKKLWQKIKVVISALGAIPKYLEEHLNSIRPQELPSTN